MKSHSGILGARILALSFWWERGHNSNQYRLWCLLVCVNLAKQQYPKIRSNSMLGVSLKLFFKMRLIYKTVHYKLKQLILYSWVGFFSSYLKVLIGKKLNSLEKGILPTDCFWTSAETLTCISILADDIKSTLISLSSALTDSADHRSEIFRKAYIVIHTYNPVPLDVTAGESQGQGQPVQLSKSLSKINF